MIRSHRRDWNCTRCNFINGTAIRNDDKVVTVVLKEICTVHIFTFFYNKEDSLHFKKVPQLNPYMFRQLPKLFFCQLTAQLIKAVLTANKILSLLSANMIKSSL
jgi:hypothetical protein